MTSDSATEAPPARPAAAAAAAEDWPARLRGGLRWLDRRELVVLGAILAVSVLLRLVTWNAVADGVRGAYFKTTLFGAFAALAVWALVRVQSGRGSWIPVLAAAAVLLSGDAVHYVRLANPIAHGGPVQQFKAGFADPVAARRQWYAEEGGDGKVRFEGGQLVLQVPPSSTAFVVARLDGSADTGTRWWLPVALAKEEPSEELTWRASIQRDGDYLVVADMQPLLIQAVTYGLHITYPDPKGTAQGHEVSNSTVLDGRPHDWKIVRNGQEIVFTVDGTRIWAAPQRGPLRQIKLGETKVDPSHGGTIRVESVTYTSHLDRE
jgi:hypothetical protein